MIEIDVVEASVLTGKDSDIVYVQISDFTPFPNWLPNMKPIFKIEVEQGYGVEFVKKIFNVSATEVQIK